MAGISKPHHTSEEIEKVLDFVDDGLSYRKIEELTGIGKSTVGDWLSKR
jgi:transposase